MDDEYKVGLVAIVAALVLLITIAVCISWSYNQGGDHARDFQVACVQSGQSYYHDHNGYPACAKVPVDP